MIHLVNGAGFVPTDLPGANAELLIFALAHAHVGIVLMNGCLLSRLRVAH